jgi:hypothetical protein
LLEAWPSDFDFVLLVLYFHNALLVVIFAIKTGDMTNNTKDIVQYSCAVFSLVAGITLCYINFLLTVAGVNIGYLLRYLLVVQ